jgi:hypothetical protein
VYPISPQITGNLFLLDGEGVWLRVPVAAVAMAARLFSGTLLSSDTPGVKA